MLGQFDADPGQWIARGIPKLDVQKIHYGMEVGELQLG